jgi:N-dimethylarginine dimethylaminohydrolase
MKRFLMCEPRFFDVCYVINPWMHGNVGKVDKQVAWQQWQKLHDIVAKLASVSLIEPVVGLPDMVFTANAGLVYRRDVGRTEVVLSSFLHTERRPEAKFFEQFFLAQDCDVLHLRPDTIFEGAGDALFDALGRLWVGSGMRSQLKAQDEIVEILGVEIHAVELVDPRWYHLDTAFCPLPGNRAIAYKKAFTSKSIEVLDDAFAQNVIWVSDADARNFACNAISIDPFVILHRASANLESTLSRLGLQVIAVDVSEFIKAGGACKCLTLEI